MLRVLSVSFKMRSDVDTANNLLTITYFVLTTKMQTFANCGVYLQVILREYNNDKRLAFQYIYEFGIF